MEQKSANVAEGSSGSDEEMENMLKEFKDEEQEEETTTSGKWFPGKHLKKAVQKANDKRKEVRKHVKETVFESVVALKKEKNKGRKSNSQSQQLGNVQISILRGEEMNGKHPYLEVELEGTSHRTKYSVGSTCEWPEATFDLSFTDPTSDICIFVFDEIIMGADPIIGRVLIPLTHFYEIFDTGPSKTFWAEILPLSRSPKEQLKYASAIKNYPGSGLIKPKRALGKLLITAQVQLKSPLLLSYFKSKPIFEKEDFTETEVDETGEETVSAMSLHRNGGRLGRVLGAPRVISLMFKFPFSIIYLPLYYYLCFHFSWSSFPFVVFALCLLNGIISTFHSHSEHIILWDRDTGPSALPKGISGKFAMIKDKVLTIQKGLGKASDILENLEYIGNFSDPRISTIFYFVFFCVASVLSIFMTLLPNGFVSCSLCLIPIFISIKNAVKPPGANQSIKHSPTMELITNFMARIPNCPELDHRTIARDSFSAAKI